MCFCSCRFSVYPLKVEIMLQGNNLTDEYGPKNKNEPRRSWMMRKRQERAAMKEGLAEWQANPYFCAGRVTVPALMDTVACQCFINT
jgi:hypothetical protein